MSQTVITTAFEQLKAQQAANGGVLVLDEFVFANIPNLNINDPIDRAESWPAASQIVYRQAVSKTGMVNDNAVVYSVVLGADAGDFEFNWVGLINKASNTVCMIVHAPLQKKIRTASGQQGNVLTRSFLMEYNGASQQTQIISPVDTWQIDFTARLSGMDERQRLENIDTYGEAGFLGDGWLVIKNGNAYTVKHGVGYVAGLRAELLVDQDITVNAKPSKIWVDVCWRGLLTSTWSVVSKITVAPKLENYFDNGEPHYVYAVAEIASDGTIKDLRPSENKTSRKIDELPERFLNRHEPFADIKADGKAAVETALENLGLGLLASLGTPSGVLTGGTGIVRLPIYNGEKVETFIIQWMPAPALPANGGAVVNFPTAFPNALLNLTPAGGATSPGIPGINGFARDRISCSIWNQSRSEATQIGSIIAFGY